MAANWCGRSILSSTNGVRSCLPTAGGWRTRPRNPAGPRSSSLSSRPRRKVSDFQWRRLQTEVARGRPRIVLHCQRRPTDVRRHRAGQTLDSGAFAGVVSDQARCGEAPVFLEVWRRPRRSAFPHDSTKSRSRNGGGHGGAELARVASWLRRTSAVPREARWRICPGRCDAAGGEVLVGVRNIDTRDTGAAPILREGENVCAPPQRPPGRRCFHCCGNRLAN